VTLPFATGEVVVASASWMAKPGQPRRLRVTATPLAACVPRPEGGAQAAAERYPNGVIFMIRFDRGAAGETYATESFASLPQAKAWAEARWPGLAWEPA
jgi:hypothetical protein